MNNASLSKVFGFTAILFTLAGCGGNGSSGTSSLAQNQACTLNGAWKTCQTDGTDSQTVLLDTVAGTTTETIETFSGTTDCSGTSGGTMSFPITIALQAAGQSAILAGGTDAKVTPPTGADFGCGTDSPLYTALIFAGNCSSFQTVQTACSSGAVTSTLTPFVYTKQ